MDAILPFSSQAEQFQAIYLPRNHSSLFCTTQATMSPVIQPDAWPDSITDPDIRQVLETFYELSNSANSAKDIDANEKAFADLFDSEKGVYQLASKKAEGRDGE